jgi:hypothetical protein
VGETEAAPKTIWNGSSRETQVEIAPATAYTAVRPVEQDGKRLLAAAAGGCLTSMLAVGRDPPSYEMYGVRWGGVWWGLLEAG